MGLFKKLLEEKDLDQTIYCRFCGSDYASFTKIIGYGNKMGKVFHFKRKCNICRKEYMVKKNKYVFDMVKNDNWIKTKSFKKEFDI